MLLVRRVDALPPGPLPISYTVTLGVRWGEWRVRERAAAQPAIPPPMMATSYEEEEEEDELAAIVVVRDLARW